MGKEESWVTIVLSDEDAVDALILAKSIKRTLSTKLLTVLYGEHISVELRRLLGEEFDLILRINDIVECFPRDKQETGNQFFALWRLTKFGKCVYLDTRIVVLGNSDEIFEEDDLSGLYDGADLNYSVFVFKPSLKRFDQLLQYEAGRKDGGDPALVSCAKVWNAGLKKTLKAEWASELNSHLIFEKIKILQTGGISSLSNQETTRKNMADKPSSFVLEIYREEVLPLLIRKKVISPVKSVMQLENILPSFDECLTGDQLSGSQTAPPEIDNSEDAIAVVGMSCRFPGANNVEEYWDLLSEGREAIVPFPSERQSFSLNFAPFAGIASDIQAGFLKCSVDEFDAPFFGISPREAPLIDPQQRLLLEVTWESLENAGINPQRLRGTNTGVFTGIWQQDYDRLLHGYTKTSNDLFHRYLGNAFSATASRVSYFLGLHGPAVALESGCSSSLGGMHLACESLRKGETNLAISSGVNLILIGANPFTRMAQGEEGEDSIVLSKDFKCKTFDAGANGFVRAEGCGVLVLKRYVNARKDGDRILAVVRGSAMNNDGTGTSFGTPNAFAQEQVFLQALRNAHVEPSEVSFLEAHGTGTPVGDPIEMVAIRRVYSKNRSVPLYVSSVKTNIGHCEAAAGIASVIKAILCLQHRTIPRHLNLQTLNPYIQLDSIPAIIPLENVEWNAEPRICGVSSFSMSATNVHAILQEAPLRPPCPTQSLTGRTKPPLIVTISAKSSDALKALTASYIKYLEGTPDVTLEDFAYATNIGRAHLLHRIAVSASSIPELVESLKTEDWSYGKVGTGERKVAFLFPGQGSQYFGMMKDMAETFPVVSTALRKAGEIFEAHLNVALTHVLWGDPELLNRTIYCQPAIVAVEYALVELWKSFGVTPDVVLGHSLGEIAAAITCQALTLEEGLGIIITRSKLVDQLEKGAMVAVCSNETSTNSLIQEFLQNQPQNSWIDTAAVNSTQEVVVSGPDELMKTFTSFCSGKTVNTIPISASHAFHSREMESVLGPFGRALQPLLTKVRDPTCDFISATQAKLISTASELGPTYWQSHLRDSVQFSKAFAVLKKDYKVFVEIGSHPVLLGLAMNSFDESGISTEEMQFAPSARRTESTRLTFRDSLIKLYLSGLEIDWTGQTPTKQRHLELPTYPFQRISYWCNQSEEDGDESWGGSNLPKLHPLLGSEIFTPKPGKVYSNVLRTRELPYLPEHKIAGHVVYPAAAFVETLLATGREILQGGGTLNFPLVIEDFSIDCALDVEKAVEMQTTVEQREGDDGNGIGYKIQIFRKFLGGTFKRNVSGTYIPCAKLSKIDKLDLLEVRARLEHKKVNMKSLYAILRKRGIEFGPLFQSIKYAWTSPATGEILTELEYTRSGSLDLDYICHPILLDALIQTQGLKIYLKSGNTGRAIENEIYLPIQIRRVVWLPGKFTPKLFAYSEGESGEASVVTLLNEEGEPLVRLEGLELLQTTCQTVINLISQQSPTEVKLSGEIWRHIHTGTGSEISTAIPHFRRVDLEGEELGRIIGKRMSQRLDDALNDLTVGATAGVAKAIQSAKFPYEVGRIIKPEDWQKLLPESVPPQMINVFMIRMEMGGYLQRISDAKEIYQIKLELPPFEETYARICRVGADHTSIMRYTALWVQKLCEELPLVFQGKMSPLEYHFPSDESKMGAIKFYNMDSVYKIQCEAAIELLMQTVGKLVLSGGENTDLSSRIVRILEVGGGSGYATNILIAKLKTAGIPFKYTFTDISPVLLEEGKKSLKSHEGVIFKIFDIEKDPLHQGFLPESVDIILALQVLHATQDLKETLQNLNQTLSVGGKLILSEFIDDTPDLVDITFGMLEGWWRFNDFRKENKNHTPKISKEKWQWVLESTGFLDIVCFESIYNSGALSATKSSNESQIETKTGKPKQWLVFSDGSSLVDSVASLLTKQHRLVAVTPIKDADFDAILASVEPESLEGILYFWTTHQEESDPAKMLDGNTRCLMSLFQARVKSTDKKLKPILYIVTRGAQFIGDDEVPTPSKTTLWGLTKSFRNEFARCNPCLVDFAQKESEWEADQLFALFWDSNRQFELAFRGKKMYALRYVEALPRRKNINLPNTDRYKFINPPSGSFTDIAIGPAHLENLTGKDVEVSVRAVALNFKDLFCVLKPEGFIIPPKHVNTVGMDISGKISRIGPEARHFQVGDDVFGFTINGGIASHVLTPEFALWKKPSWLSYEEAAGIPSVYLTVYYGLIHLGKISAGDRVLIHVASGGVGLAAINVVRANGGIIFATAGSKRKRRYLESIGVQNVYDSRNTDYSARILAETEGRGVDIVLNSLTSPGFKEATLAVTALGGRFIEMAKLNIWEEAEVKALRPDVDYQILDLTTMNFEDEGDLEVSRKLEQEVHQGKYAPIPCKVFPLEEIQSAFYYFQEAKQIGKVVLKVPVTELRNGTMVHTNQAFNPDGSYLLTGGLGGIGLELTQWMATKGARHIILVGRNPPSPTAQQVLSKFTATGTCKVVVVNMDIGKRVDCEKLFHMLRSEGGGGMPPLKGIFHGAGELHDDVFENQNWETMRTSLVPKAFAAWHLHQLTQENQSNLDFFILFSSIASCFGSLGQCPHVTANRYLDSFASYRHALGLPATSINWGVWQNVGAAAKLANTLENRFGLLGFPPAQGLLALEKILTVDTPQVGFAPIRDWTLIRQVFSSGQYFDEVAVSNSSNRQVFADVDKIIQGIKAAPPGEREGKIQNYLADVIKETLRLPGDEVLDIDQPINEMGVDSLMAMEMKSKLQKLVNNNIPVAVLQEKRTIRKLSAYLAEALSGEESVPRLSDMMRLDSILPPEIQTNDLSGPICPSELYGILLTGVTGHLGAHILSEIQNYNKRLTVYCLVRASSEERAIQILRETLEYYQLHSVYMERIIVICGDVSKEQFGMSGEAYADLLDKVNGVVHCAFKTKHADSYYDGSPTDMRTVNVHGLIRILKFATGGSSVKRIMYPSTLLVMTEPNESGTFPEGWISQDAYKNVESGYLQSKCICEALLHQASEIGIPCTIFRLPLLFASTETGIRTRSVNHVYNFILTGLKMRKFPKLEHTEGIPIFPVNFASRICSEIWLSDDSEEGIYNLTNSRILADADLQEIVGEMGINVEFVSLDDWRDSMFEDLEEGLLVGSIDEKSRVDLPNPQTLHAFGEEWNRALYVGSSEKCMRNLPSIDEINSGYSPKELFHLQLTQFMRQPPEISNL